MDPFDPRGLLDREVIRAPARIWLNESHTLFAVVDGDLWPWLSQWVWTAHFDDKGMLYPARQTRQGGREGPRTRFFMHREVLRHTRRRRASPAHDIVDHINGDTTDNRRTNLRWATRSMNAKNVHRVRWAFPDSPVPASPAPTHDWREDDIPWR